MQKYLVTGAIGLTLSFHAMAQSYQFEANANYSKLNADSDFDFDAHTASVSGVYYFSPVATDKHPLREASFLAKSSSMSLAYLGYKSTSSHVYEDDYVRAESNYRYKSSGLVVIAETYILNDLVYLSGFIAHTKEKDTDTSIITSDTYSYINSKETNTEENSDNNWRVNLGIAPTEGLLIWSELEKDVNIGHSWNLNAKYVMEFNSTALSIQGGIAKNAISNLTSSATYFYPSNMKLNFSGDDDLNANSAYILGDYYFNNTLSLGVGASHANNSDYEDTYLVRGQKFFTDNFSVLAQYTKNDYFEVYSIGTSIRF